MSPDTLSILAIGAHPDDCDIKAGGTACLYADSGHDVRFVSMTDGGAGHHELAGARLVRRRHAEATAAAAIPEIDFTMLDTPDGRLRPSLMNRDRLIRLIRENDPDLVLTHRPNDYHPDHRYTARLVRDAAYMITVPNICPDVAPLRHSPVFAYFADDFDRPYPFSPDIVIDVDDALDRKFRMLDCHESQMYEWLAYNEGVLGGVPESDEDRLVWLREGGIGLVEAAIGVADRFRERLIERYGGAAGRNVEHAEAFEISEYGRSPDDLENLFPSL